MARGYYSDLRAFIGELERRGKLYRWRKAVNKDTELMPLMRLQYRGLSDEARQAFLYEKVTDAKGNRYDMKVITGMYGASREILTLGMGCKESPEIYEKWRHALAHPIETATVERGAVNPSQFITHVLPLEEWSRGFDLSRSGEAVKVVLEL